MHAQMHIETHTSSDILTVDPAFTPYKYRVAVFLIALTISDHDNRPITTRQ